MKKLMSLLLAAMLVLGLAACGGQAGGAPDTNQPENSTDCSKAKNPNWKIWNRR